MNILNINLIYVIRGHFIEVSNIKMIFKMYYIINIESERRWIQKKNK